MCATASGDVRALSNPRSRRLFIKFPVSDTIMHVSFFFKYGKLYRGWIVIATFGKGTALTKVYFVSGSNSSIIEFMQYRL